MKKHHNKEYKEYVSKLIVEEGRKGSDVAFELEIPYGTIRRWVTDYKEKINAGNEPEKYITPSEHQKILKQKEKEILRLQEENEILKKAMHIFTKSQE